MATATARVYDVGDYARVSVTFTDINNVVADPSDVTLTVTAPDGTAATYDYSPGPIVKDSVGNYHYDIPVTMAGDWVYVWTGTGVVATSEPGIFYARRSFVLPATALTSVGAAREFVLRDATDATQDDKLRRLVIAYSAAVYSYTKREWLPQTPATARRFSYLGGGFLSLAPYEARAVTSVVMFTDQPTANQRALVAGTTTVQGEYTLHPPQKTREGTYLWLQLPTFSAATNYWVDGDLYFPFAARGGQAEVTVTADWGVGSVPADVELAVLVAIKDAYENPTGYASGESGGLQFVEEQEAGLGFESGARNLPVESRALLTDYRRNLVAVA